MNDDFLNTYIISFLLLFGNIVLLVNILAEYVFLAYDDILLNKLNFSYLKIFHNNWNNRKSSILLNLVCCSTIFLHKNDIVYILLLKLFLIKYMLKWVSFKRIFKTKDYLSNEKIKLKDIPKIVFLFVLKNPLIKVFLFFCLIIQIFSCFWIFIGIHSFNSIERSWIKEFDHDINNYFQLFTTSVYFIITTLLTVGYGDIHPSNLNERIYVILMLFSGGIIYSFILTIIASMFINRNKRLVLYGQRLSTLTDVNNIYKLSDKIYHNTFQAINHNYKHWKEDKEDLISALPSSLKLTLQFKMYEDLILKINFLSKLTNDKNNLFNDIEIKGFLTALIPKLSYQIYKQKDIILEMGDTIEEMFFITSGSIKLTVNYGNDHLKLLKIYHGTHFGDILMNTYKSPLTIKCNSKSCKIMVLKKIDFIELKSKYDTIVINMIESSLKINNLITTKLKESEKYYKFNGDLINFEPYFKNYYKNNQEEIDKMLEKESLDNVIQKKGSIIKKILNYTIFKKSNFKRNSKNFDEDNELSENIISKKSSLKINKSYSEDSVNLTTSYVKSESLSNKQINDLKDKKQTSSNNQVQALYLNNFRLDLENQISNIQDEKFKSVVQSNKARDDIFVISYIRACYSNQTLNVETSCFQTMGKLKKNKVAVKISSIDKLQKAKIINEINSNVNNFTAISNNTNLINNELSSFINSNKKSKINVLRSRDNIRISKSSSPNKIISNKIQNKTHQ